MTLLRIKKLLRHRTLCLGLALLLCSSVALANPVADYRLKAAILYNLALFTTWPDPAKAPDSVFRFCFLNAPELKQGMQELAVSTLRGQPLELQTIQATTNLQRCEMLVVGTMPGEKWLAARESLAGAAVLTVSDVLTVQDGVMIGLASSGSRIVFDVDNSSARTVGLVLSSKLLRLARTLQ